MKKTPSRILIVLAVTAMAAGGYLFSRLAGPQGRDSKTVPAAARSECVSSSVETASIRRGAISKKIAAYGPVIPAPGARRIVSVPFESQVVNVFVNDGQRISRGDLLIEILPSPATMLEFEQASNAYSLAKQAMRQVQRKFNLKLATNEQLLNEKQKVEAARIKLESLKKQGIGGKKKIRAGIGGLVKRVDVQQGNIVPAGNPLIEIVGAGHLQVLLGVEPEDIWRVRTGQKVLLTRVSVPSAQTVTGQVEKLSFQVNPRTRLDDVFVTIPPSARFILGETVLGQIEAGAAHGLIVPRSAVLTEHGRPYVFIVQNGVARKRTVGIVFENASEYIISGEGVSEGDQAVTLGNYELKNGMAVEARPQPSSLDPSGTSPTPETGSLQSTSPSAGQFRPRGADR